MKNELRWGFLGNARIASRAILPALGASNAGRAVAIASRDREGATRTAIQFGIDRIYEDYQALIADPNVDAVYIGLPNSAHAYWIRAAVQAGKHVLCEKPITLSAAELEGVADLAAAQGVFVQEGLMVWTHPRWHRVRQLTAFTDAVLRRREPAVPLASSIANMRALDALSTSARSGAWEKV